MTQRPTHQARRAKLAEKLRAQRRDNASGSQGDTPGAPETTLRRSGGVSTPGDDIEGEVDDSEG